MTDQPTNTGAGRENWGTRMGVILAVAGSAVGLGNFLRFPGVAVSHGGGVFMIPYFLAFLLVGVPLCWAEWSMGRGAGRRSNLASAYGLMGVFTNGSRLRYFGVLGLFIPLVINIYYVYIESWCLAYAWFSLRGVLYAAQDIDYTQFFAEYTGSAPPLAEGATRAFFPTHATAFWFFCITFVVNFVVVYRGVSQGIEKFCMFAMPTLLFLALVILVFMMMQPGIYDALGYMWNPHGGNLSLESIRTADFSNLLNPSVWLAAIGQIFYSMSVGFGVILTYASYLESRDDVVLSGLTASTMNQFCEVCLAGMIVIPAAILFLRIAQAESIAQAGLFGLGFVTMPQVFSLMPGGPTFSFMFYTLLFMAGVTSSLSMLHPAITFLEEGFELNRRTSATLIGLISFAGTSILIMGTDPNFVILSTLDSYACEIGIPLFAFVQTLIFIFYIKTPNIVKEASVGAAIRLPRLFPFVFNYITPTFLGVILFTEMFRILKSHGLLTMFVPLLAFINPAWVDVLAPASELSKDRCHIELFTTIGMVLFLLFCLLLAKLAWPRMRYRWKHYQSPDGEKEPVT